MNPDEFQYFIKPLTNGIYSLAMHLLKDEDQAKDATQEVLIKLWKMRDQLSELKSGQAFCYRVTRNYCLDMLKARRTISIDSSVQAQKAESGSASPHEILEQKGKYEILNWCIEKLPPMQKLILKLRDVEGFEFEEIAERTELAVGAIRTNLSRARNFVKNEFLKQYNHEQFRIEGAKRKIF